MANNTYVIDELALPGTGTQTVVDDGTGIDWLVFKGVRDDITDIDLSWSSDSSGSTEAEGAYDLNDGGNRLIVVGLIENVRGSKGRDYIQGNEADNLLYGDYSASSTGGDDTIIGGAGNDRIYGGAGNDEIAGGADDDRLYGNAGNDIIEGNAGIDIIEGGAGADKLNGGSDKGDAVTYASSSAAVNVLIVYGSVQTGAGGDAQGDKITGFTDVIGSAHNDVISDRVKETIAFGYNDNTFHGGAGNDKLYLGGGNDIGDGGSGNDLIKGELGDDTLSGGAGDDILEGGVGGDALAGGSGVDTASYVDSASAVWASLTKPSGNTNDAAGDTYSSIERLVGTAFADRLEGNSYANTLEGRDGNDRLTGGLGNDVLIGGAGQDIFVFNAKLGSTNVDTIDDFSAADDTIWLDDDIFTKAGPVDDLATGAFWAGTAAHDGSDRIIYDKLSGKLWYDADGTGSIAAAQFALLDKGLTLTSADFDIIA